MSNKMQIYTVFTYDREGKITEVNCYSTYEKAEKRIEIMKKKKHNCTYAIEDGELDWGLFE